MSRRTYVPQSVSASTFTSSGTRRSWSVHLSSTRFMPCMNTARRFCHSAGVRRRVRAVGVVVVQKKVRAIEPRQILRVELSVTRDAGSQQQIRRWCEGMNACPMTGHGVNLPKPAG